LQDIDKISPAWWLRVAKTTREQAKKFKNGIATTIKNPK